LQRVRAALTDHRTKLRFKAVIVKTQRNTDSLHVLQIREYGGKVGSVLRETSDRGALLQTVASTRDVLPGVPYRDFQAVIESTDVDSQFLQAVSAARMTEPQVDTLADQRGRGHLPVGGQK